MESNGRNYSISCVRFIAMCFIVICHIMQAEGVASCIGSMRIEWAYWFNVGVQMFLFISGCLYGSRKCVDILKFYKKSFSKVLVDYYIYIVVFIIFSASTSVIMITKDDIIALLTLSGTIFELAHLWYVPTILFCYLLLPIVIAFVNEIDKEKDYKFVLKVALLLLVVHCVIHYQFDRFEAPWINCFVIGAIYSRLIHRRYVIRKIFFASNVILAITFIIIQLRFVIPESFENFGIMSYSEFVGYGHVFLGITLVEIIKYVYSRCHNANDGFRLLDWSDRYSYDVYLVHHAMIQGGLSLLRYINPTWVAIVVDVFVIVILSMVLNICSSQIRRLTYLYRGKNGENAKSLF